MANEVQYDAHKRKYDDDVSPSPPQPRRRISGFSDGPPAAAPPQYGNVPPPAPATDDFALIKQNFQQLASRALSNSNINPNPNNNGDAVNVNKRSKFDDSTPGYSSNYDSYSDQKPLPSGNQFGSTLSGPAPHGYSGSGNKKIEIPNGRVGVIIGKAGETIKNLQNQSGARIQITRDADQDPYSQNREVELMGTEDQIARAEQLIHDVIAEAETGGLGSVSRNMPAAPGSEQFAMKIPSNKVGLVIGKGGETIKNIQSQSGARVQVIPLHPPPGDMSMERTVQIDGTSEQIEIAKQMVYDATEKRNRNPAMSGGYSQQGYQSQTPTNWAPQPPQSQQPAAYGYMQQTGPYSNAPLQYPQQPYSGYPHQTTSGRHPQNWDPSSATQTQQGSGGYDYYGQQQPTQQQPSGIPSDKSGYGYSQQGYTQEYPGYGYGSTPGYGNPTNTQSQGETGQVPSSYPTQGETGQVPPASQPQQEYSGQPGYGMPPTSQPGYGAPSSAGQPGYPPSQAPAQQGYSQPDAGVPQTAYGGSTTQPGAYPSPYSAPPVNLPSYGQQQPGYYGGGYYQPPAYPTEGNGSAASVAAAAAAATPSPASQPTGTAKTSP